MDELKKDEIKEESLEMSMIRQLDEKLDILYQGSTESINNIINRLLATEQALDTLLALVFDNGLVIKDDFIDMYKSKMDDVNTRMAEAIEKRKAAMKKE